MKRLLACTKTTVILLIVAVISLGFFAYMLARPVSYGMGYHNESVYEGAVFEGTIKFYPDGEMTINSSSFAEEMTYRYYYKDGYVFNILATTDEEYEKEIAQINNDFEAALDSPFYSNQINAFRMVAVGADGYTVVYTCTPAIIFAVAYGLFELMLIGVICFSFSLCKKAKCNE